MTVVTTSSASSETQSAWRRFGIPIASVVAVLFVTVVLWLSVGVAGILVAGVVSIVWSVVRTEYAVAIGGLMYVVLLSSTEQYAALAATSLAAVFVADAIARWPLRTAGIAVFVLLPGVAAFSETSRLDPTWRGAFALLAGFVAVAYAIHRYELVRLGLVGGRET